MMVRKLLKLQRFLNDLKSFQQTKSILMLMVNLHNYYLAQFHFPRPGPTFDIEDAAPETAVIKFKPVSVNKADITKKIII